MIPTPDVLPVPAPIPLVEGLLHFTFLVHLLLMNLLVGGAVLAFVESRRSGEASKRLASGITKLLPTVMAFTVTFGVAPLLFVQVLYGHLLYATGVLTAWWWFLVIPTLIVLYYLAYAMAFRRKAGRPVPAGLLAWLGAGLLAVAFVYVNEMSLAIRPAAWAARWADGAGGGNLNLDDPTLIPRYLHMILGAAAVAGLAVALVASQMRDLGSADASHRLGVGAAWFLIPTGLQIIVGFWLLVALPRNVMLRFMGESGHATGLLMIGLLGAIGTILLLVIGRRKPDPRPWTNATVGVLLVTMATMVLLRDEVRQGMLDGTFDVRALETASQTPVVLGFLGLLVVGGGVVVWMGRALVRGGGR